MILCSSKMNSMWYLPQFKLVNKSPRPFQEWTCFTFQKRPRMGASLLSDRVGLCCRDSAPLFYPFPHDAHIRRVLWTQDIRVPSSPLRSVTIEKNLIITPTIMTPHVLEDQENFILVNMKHFSQFFPVPFISGLLVPPFLMRSMSLLGSTTTTRKHFRHTASME